MKNEKKYYSISEVAQILNLKEHVIRHWDSIDPKTKKLRIEDLSIRTNGGTRFFNKKHIQKLSNLNSVLKENGKRNYSLNLASKIISKDKTQSQDALYSENRIYSDDSVKTFKNYNKIQQIVDNLKDLIR